MFKWTYALALAGSVSLLGCGDGGDGEETAAIVDVVAQEYTFTLSQASMSAGAIDFVVDNRGANTHSFEVVETDLAPESLPLNADGSFDENGDGVDVKGKIDAIAPGSSEHLTLTLDSGAYVLLCNRVVSSGGVTISHFHQGMYAPFTVQ